MINMQCQQFIVKWHAQLYLYLFVLKKTFNCLIYCFINIIYCFINIIYHFINIIYLFINLLLTFPFYLSINRFQSLNQVSIFVRFHPKQNNNKYKITSYYKKYQNSRYFINFVSQLSKLFVLIKTCDKILKFIIINRYINKNSFSISIFDSDLIFKHISYLITIKNQLQLNNNKKSTKEVMIKQVMINRLSDGTIFCQTSPDYTNTQLQTIKMKVKSYHREVTSYHKSQSQSSLHQIQNTNYSIYYKVQSFVIFTFISQLHYPSKLASIFLETICSAFFDQAKTLLGSHDLGSRLQSIQGSHYFIKFDRVIKLKIKEYDDPKTTKNTDRMKKQLQNIQQIMRQNMSMLSDRHRELEETGEKARLVNQEAKKFQSKTKKLKWTMWWKKNMVWIVIILIVVILGWIII